MITTPATNNGGRGTRAEGVNRVYFIKPNRVFWLLLLLVVGVTLTACGDASNTSSAIPSAASNSNSNATPSPSSSPIISPESLAEQLATSLKSGSGLPQQQGQGAQNALSPATQAALRGQGNSAGNIYATATYGNLQSFTPFKRLTVADTDPNKVVILESLFKYALTNGVARLGVVKSETSGGGGKWTIVATRLDFDPPGVVTQSGSKNDGLDKFRAKSLLEALGVGAENDVIERVDQGLPEIFGSGVGILTITNKDWWENRQKPFALSTRSATEEGRSPQWLVNFEGRNFSGTEIMGTIRLLDGQPWGIWYEAKGGSTFSHDTYFQLGGIKSDSTTFCRGLSNKADCENLAYGVKGWASVM